MSESVTKNIEITSKKLEKIRKRGITQEKEYLFENIAKDIAKLTSKEVSILDVGCRSGHLFDYLKSFLHFFSFYGIDISSDAIDLLHEKGYRGEVLDITRNTLPCQFDIITLIHTLEHLDDPYIAIEHCAQMLNSNGIIYVETPREKEPNYDAGHFWAFPNLYELKKLFNNKWKIEEEYVFQGTLIIIYRRI